jgi:hypothetical protein
MSHHFPWYVPHIVDRKVAFYAGPFTDAAARDAHTSEFPSSCGTPIQTGSNPNDAFPHARAIVTAVEGSHVVWSDGTMTDA